MTRARIARQRTHYDNRRQKTKTEGTTQTENKRDRKRTNEARDVAGERNGLTQTTESRERTRAGGNNLGPSSILRRPEKYAVTAVLPPPLPLQTHILHGAMSAISAAFLCRVGVPPPPPASRHLSTKASFARKPLLPSRHARLFLQRFMSLLDRPLGLDA